MYRISPLEMHWLRIYVQAVQWCAINSARYLCSPFKGNVWMNSSICAVYFPLNFRKDFNCLNSCIKNTNMVEYVRLYRQSVLRGRIVITKINQRSERIPKLFQNMLCIIRQINIILMCYCQIRSFHFWPHPRLILIYQIWLISTRFLYM